MCEKKYGGKVVLGPSFFPRTAPPLFFCERKRKLRFETKPNIGWQKIPIQNANVPKETEERQKERQKEREQEKKIRLLELA